MRRASSLVGASRRLSAAVDLLDFAPPVAFVYNPLVYARSAHEAYLDRYGGAPKRVVFVGMNPGPWGMAQTGVPFGEVAAVRDWMGIEEPVGRPPAEHPARPIEGFRCARSEVSGRRVWTLMRERFGSASAFFADHFVANYCPLVFMEESGRNRTPDKLPRGESARLFALCDEHLREVVRLLRPQWLIGVGKFASERAAWIAASSGREPPRVGSILHPSPANPRANRAWESTVTAQLRSFGVWG